jgi:hypothetical protein
MILIRLIGHDLLKIALIIAGCQAESKALFMSKKAQAVTSLAENTFSMPVTKE